MSLQASNARPRSSKQGARVSATCNRTSAPCGQVFEACFPDVSGLARKSLHPARRTTACQRRESEGRRRRSGACGWELTHPRWGSPARWRCSRRRLQPSCGGHEAPDTGFATEIGGPWFIRQVMRLLSRRIRKLAGRQGVRYSFLFMKASGDQLRALGPDRRRSHPARHRPDIPVRIDERGDGIRRQRANEGQGRYPDGIALPHGNRRSRSGRAAAMSAAALPLAHDATRRCAPTGGRTVRVFRRCVAQPHDFARTPGTSLRSSPCPEGCRTPRPSQTSAA